MKLRHQPLALAVITALLSPLAQAATSENTAGVISGRQIQLTGTPTLSGTGIEEQTLTVTLPGTSDADNDQLADWRYQWKRDGIAIGSETDAGSTTAIPAYTVEAADVGKAITLCLKALADKGYPLETKVSSEACSNAITAKPIADTVVVPGVGTFTRTPARNYLGWDATTYCNNYVSQDGYSNWRQPSLGELQQLYKLYPNNTVYTELGWPTNAEYWSSSIKSNSWPYLYFGHYLIDLRDGRTMYNDDSNNAYTVCMK